MKSLILTTLTLFALNAQAETKTYSVEGMTCGNCVKKVKAQVCKIPGVTDCKVDVGQVSLTSDKLDDAEVTKAITAAGFKLAPSSTTK